MREAKLRLAPNMRNSKGSETTNRYIHMKHSILLQMKLKSQNEIEVQTHLKTLIAVNSVKASKQNTKKQVQFGIPSRERDRRGKTVERRF